VEQFVNENGNEEIIVLQSEDRKHTGQNTNNNKWLDRILTTLLCAGIFFLFIFTFGNKHEIYWVYLMNFLVIPFIGVVSISLNEKKKGSIVVFVWKVAFRILVILFIISESIMQYNNHSIFSTIKTVLRLG
jgi:hypothetical protein